MSKRRPNPWRRSGPAVNARARGIKAKKAGALWESLLARAAETYRLQRRANIRRVGAPFRPTRAPTGGEHHGVFEGEGPCDFLGHVGPVPFEADAKRTGLKTRLPFSALKRHQAESLDMVAEVGGYAGILVQVGGRGFWLPWPAVADRWWAWHNTREAGGKVKRGGASISLTDCVELGVEFQGGDFLDAVLEAGRG